VYRYTKTTPAQPDARGPDAGDEAFRRDAPTLLSYGALAGYAFWLYAFGPGLALLRTELRFSYTLLGVYSALWAAGAALAGMTFAALAGRLTRTSWTWHGSGRGGGPAVSRPVPASNGAKGRASYCGGCWRGGRGDLCS
jgi:hypothetical protein